MSDKKSKNISWEALQSMGNPENAPEEPKEDMPKPNHFIAKSTIRVHLEKRRGKWNTIIKGLEMTNALMKDLEREIKSFCGVGGTQKNGEIIIQGDKRDKIVEFLKDKGAKNIKKAGA